MSNGLTVPFALVAGISGAIFNSHLVTAGLAEVAAGSIAMGLGGYLAPEARPPAPAWTDSLVAAEAAPNSIEAFDLIVIGVQRAPRDD